MQCCDLYPLPDLKGLTILWRFCDCFAILASNDRFAAELLELVAESVNNSDILPATELPSSCSLPHGPNDYECIRDGHLISELIEYIRLLMCIDNRRKVDLPRVNLFPQYWRYSRTSFSLTLFPEEVDMAHSEGFAGSMMTASLDLSSTTR